MTTETVSIKVFDDSDSWADRADKLKLIEEYLESNNVPWEWGCYPNSWHMILPIGPEATALTLKYGC